MTQNVTPEYTSSNLIDWLGYIKHDEADFLKKLCLSLPENPFVVNIGAGAGTSALIFLESRPDLTSCTVDIQAESSPYGCLEGEMNALKQANADLSRHQQIHGDSIEVGKTWKGKSPDLVFIDGNHTYEGCKGDIEAWLPLLKPSGILAIHDYNKTEKEYPGVNDSVNELLLGKYLKIDHKTYSLIAFKNERI